MEYEYLVSFFISQRMKETKLDCLPKRNASFYLCTTLKITQYYCVFFLVYHSDQQLRFYEGNELVGVDCRKA